MAAAAALEQVLRAIRDDRPLNDLPLKPLESFKRAMDYEDWLRAQLPDGFAPTDLDRKHTKMRQNAFSFLRATYYRWAETFPRDCPELQDAPLVLAVGDIDVGGDDDRGRYLHLYQSQPGY